MSTGGPVATSCSVGKHHENFIKNLVDSGRYATASEVIREGLRLVEEREQLRAAKLEASRTADQEGQHRGPAEPFEVWELINNRNFNSLCQVSA
ncbi:type II toxin-antitoxin system ParD family antitoxin [Bradyrhizobium sp. 5.13L]